MNLGRYPSTSLSDARNKARENRENILNGTHINQESMISQGSLEDLINYYIGQMRTEGKRSWKKVLADIQFNVFTVIGKNTLAKDVDPTQIRKVLHKIIQRGAEVQANRIRSYLHRAFEIGIFHDNDPKSLTHIRDFFFSKLLISRYRRFYTRKSPLKSMAFFLNSP